MKIAVIGAGGVGGYFGGKLAHAGRDVTFVARGAHLDALLKNGLIVKSILGDFRVPSVKATSEITSLGKPDLIIIATKAWQLKEIRDDLKKIVHSETMVLPLQNGISAVDELSEAVDRKHLLGGLCRIISKIEAPGIISHFAINPVVIFGEPDKVMRTRSAIVKHLFDSAGINAMLTDDIEAELWKKFIGICISGLIAITRATYGELRAIPETRQMMIELLTEIYLLSKKASVIIEDDFVDRTVAAIDSFPFDSTPSLARDVWESRPSEIEYQNGTVVRLAKKYNLRVPVNDFVYRCILAMELKARRPG